MARRRIDLTGQRFGRLTVISLNEETTKQKGRGAYWNCKCDCGNEKVVCGGHLKSGGTTSCGCYQREKIKEKWKDEDFRKMQSDKMREMAKEKWKDEEFRQMQRNGTKEKWKDEELRQMQSNRMREMVKEKWQDEEYRQMKSNKAKEQWKDEEMKWKMGYKGGITPISSHLRNLPVVKEWRKNTYTRENNKCQLTGKHVHGGNSDVHHLYGFNMIVIEAHELHNIQIHEIVSEYTQEELYKLEQYIEKWHKDTSNAVLLCEEVHKIFHNLYGRGGNTPEQFEEFKERYLSGEFEENIK